MRAVITLDDHEDGHIGMTMYFEDGFQATSPAHQCASIMVSHMDDIAQTKQAERPTWVAGKDAEWIKGSIIASPEIQANPTQ